MQITEQEKREAIASELADVLYRQQMIVKCNDTLEFTAKDEINEVFHDMAEEDEKNLRMIETAIGNFGLRVNPKESAVTIAEAICEVIEDNTSLPIEKLSAYTLLKQNQVMCSHLVHKSVQLSKPDIKAALLPYDGIYATFSKHVTQLTAQIERAGVEWITGETPMTGILGRARDAAATVVGGVMSKAGKPADEMNVLNILKMDHRKTETLFKEIKTAKDRQEAIDLFGQLKADLTAHSEAEEEIVYRKFLKIPELKTKLDDAWREHVKMRALLDSISHAKNDQKTFLTQVQELEDLVQHHVREEENEIMNLIEKHTRKNELVALSQEFMQAKQVVQETMSAQGLDAPVSGMMKGSRTDYSAHI